MELLRVFISLVCFGLGVYLVINGFTPVFEWHLLLFAALAFLTAYFFWPSKRRGQRSEGNQWLDLLEFMVELPIEIFLWVFRLFARLFKDADAGIDL